MRPFRGWNVARHPPPSQRVALLGLVCEGKRRRHLRFRSPLKNRLDFEKCRKEPADPAFPKTCKFAFSSPSFFFFFSSFPSPSPAREVPVVHPMFLTREIRRGGGNRKCPAGSVRPSDEMWGPPHIHPMVLKKTILVWAIHFPIILLPWLPFRATNQRIVPLFSMCPSKYRLSETIWVLGF